MALPTRFDPGTKVSWTSNFKRKIGDYVAFLPANQNINTVLPQGVLSSHIKIQHVSQVDRHIVSVPRGGLSVLSDYFGPTVHMGVRAAVLMTDGTYH